MGNQLLKGYSIQGEPKAGVGSEKMWKIYQGQKHGTNSLATIFAIEKRSLPKAEREQLIAFGKKQAMGLARIRHPGVLAISQTLIEDENILAFSTEPILGNLTTLCRQRKLKQLISSQTELRLNLFPMLDTLKFLHENVKTAHLSLNFDNLYITREGKWKIGGLSNSQVFTCESTELQATYRCSEYSFKPPQMALHNTFSPKSDVYSFGVVLLRLLDLLRTGAAPQFYKNRQEYQATFQSDLMAKINSDSLAELENAGDLKTLMAGMLAARPEHRIDIQEVQASRWLNDEIVLTVKHLENITSMDNKQQVDFLKGLLGILNHFDSSLLLKRIVPLLLDLLKFKHLIPSIIFISLEMLKEGKILSADNFSKHVWPHLKKVMQGKEMTAHSIYILVDNMKVLQAVVSVEGLVQTVVPLYLKCFDCPPKLKELALRQTDFIVKKMDYQFVKTRVIPKIMACLKDPHTDMHKNSLIALRKALKILDTQTITSMVLPALENSRKGGTDQFVNAITVSIYDDLGKSLPTEVLSTKLIPTVLPYLTDPSVKAQNFYNYKNVLMLMIHRIEKERKKFWTDGDNEPIHTFTPKDFDFSEREEEDKGHHSVIGKGNYGFLASYMQKQPVQGDQTANNDPFELARTPQQAGDPSDTQKRPQLSQGFPQSENPSLSDRLQEKPLGIKIQHSESDSVPKTQQANDIPILPQGSHHKNANLKFKGPSQAANTMMQPETTNAKVEPQAATTMMQPETTFDDPWTKMGLTNQGKKEEKVAKDPWSGLSNLNPTGPVFIQPPKTETPTDYSLDDWDFGGSTQPISNWPNPTGNTANQSHFSNPLDSNHAKGGHSHLFGNANDDPFAELEKQRVDNFGNGSLNMGGGQSMCAESTKMPVKNDQNWNTGTEIVKPSPKKDEMPFDLI